MLTGHTLDHRDTVNALAGAMPDRVTDATGDATILDRRQMAEELATELNRAGLALVRLEPEGSALRQEAETSWFSRTED